jgi:hypothetical protein
MSASEIHLFRMSAAGAFRWRSCSLLCFLVALLASANTLRADEPDPAVEATHKALRDSANFPWYDPETDDLRDLHAKARADEDTDTRKHGWEWEVKPLNTPNISWQFPTLWQIVQYTAMTLLVALILGLVFLLLRYFLKQEEEIGSPGAALSLEDQQGEIDRVEQLPFVVRRPGGDLLSEARALYEQGRYGEAIVYLYSYQLLQLDRHHLIHLAKGKTNRQYLREVRQEPRLRSILHGTMIAFEDYFFGHHDLDRERFEECWQRLDEFHGALEQGVLA